MTDSIARRTILVPLDGSSFAEQALPLAIRLARTTGSALILAMVEHISLGPGEVTDPETITAMQRLLHAEGEIYLRTVMQHCEAPDVTIETAALRGGAVPVSQVLSGYIQDAGIGMVVMATHGRGGVKRAWIGSVADSLVRQLHVPVVLTRPGSAHVPAGNRILVPLDGSPLAEAALEEACTLAAAGHHDITLLQVVQPVMRTFSPLDVPYTGFDEILTESLRRVAEDYLDDLEERVRDRGIKCTGLTMLAPNVAEAILDMARPAHFGMIAIASHGRSGLRRLVLGSVADKVVRGSEVPVLVHRPVGSAAADHHPIARAQLAGPRSCAV